MKTTPALACALLALVVSGPAGAAEDLSSRVQASKAAISAFAGSLKGALKGALQEGGPLGAIAACNERAPAIASEQSARHGLAIGRTSLGVRNPANAPDAWERSVLEDFERRRAAGEDAADLVRYEVVETDGRREFRLACHGAALAPEVASRLDALYPDDRARGFAVGDLRGAFTVRQPM